MENKPVKRPTIISLIGILNIAFGSLGLLSTSCCSLWILFTGKSLAHMPLPQAPEQARIINPVLALHETPGFIVFQCAGVIVGMLTSTLLIVSGKGFLKMKQWGRVAALGYSATGIFWGIVNWIVFMRIIHPVLVEFEKQISLQLDESTFLSLLDFLFLLYSCVEVLQYFAYPGVILILMLLPAVKNGLAGKIDPSGAPAPDTVAGGNESNNVVEQ